MVHILKKKKKTSQSASVWAYRGKELTGDVKCPRKTQDGQEFCGIY